MSDTLSSNSLQEAFGESSSRLDSIEELLNQALVLHGENRHDEATSLYLEILEAKPDLVQASFNLGTILHAGGDLTGAISYYNEVITSKPENFQALYFLANALRDQGRIDEAARKYRRAIEVNPGFADVHYNLGILYYQQGEHGRAMACFRAALNIEPSHADSLYNIGMIHLDKNDLENAAASYEKALAVRPDDVDSLYNLAFTRAKQGHLEKAALHYHEAIELAPDDAELHNSLGSILRKLNEPELAAVCYRQAVSLKPGYGSAWTNLATILQIQGDYEQAIESYSKAIELGDHTESADYMMAALTGSNRQTSPRSYVRDLYDGYAENFEKSLVGNLGYKTPEILKKTCLSMVGAEHRFRGVADLGCGTGLAGDQFRNIADNLIGVDLSEKMLSKAAERDIYDRLYNSDIIDFLEGESTPDFDLVIAADVLIYLGDLGSLFRSVNRRLTSGGYFIFSTEKLNEEGDYSLLKTGRYAHSERYIGSLAAEYGFEVYVCREAELRKEKDKWIQGYLFALRMKG